MHSLKNTIVAVGLLGLSFLFYQASSHKSPVADEMVPALEISDGADRLDPSAAMGVDASASNAIPPIDMPKIGVPDLIKPQPPAFPPGPAVNAMASPAGDASLGFSDHDSSGLTLPQPGSKPLAAPPEQPIDRVARDEGLIDVLKIQQQMSSQDQFASTPPPSNNSFVAESTEAIEVESQFKSQPIPSADSSYNTMAGTDSSKQFSSEVMHADSEASTPNLSFQAAWPRVDALIAENNYLESLRLLSGFYRSTDLNGPQRQRLLPFLDGLAGKVIFSTEHHLEGIPYTVANESLVDIGQRWKVPAQLIYNINQSQISNPMEVPGGTQLKVVQGPFDAEIDMQQHVMTLFLGDLYAGRYPIRVGISGNPQPGDFRVLLKSEVGHSWRDAQGNSYPPGAPENGYGPNWIGLSGSLCIHAIDDAATDGHHGCIGLSPNDAKDVFAILGDGSNVKILR